MTKMNKITYAILIILLSRISFADYNVFIPLDPNKIIIKDGQVNGEIKLKNSTIRRGEQTSIIWDYKYANKIEIDNIGSYTAKKGDVGISPVETTEYLANISNGENNKQEKLTLTVIQPQQQITFTSDIQKIGFGQAAKLNWNVTDANSASIDNGIGEVSFNSNQTVYPKMTTTYTLTAKGYTGISDMSKSLSIEVVPDTIISQFNVDKNKLTIGDTATFNWVVSDSELLTFNGIEVNKPSGIKEVLTTTIGDFDYTLESTSFSGFKTDEKRTISVYPAPKINSLTVNDVTTSIKVSPNDSLNFNWISSGFNEQLLDNVSVTGQSKILTAPVSGSKDYVYIARNGAGKEVQNKITVSVIQPVTITGITAPNNVFKDSPFTLSFSSSGATGYKIKSDNNESGINTTGVELGTVKTTNITPTSAGTYTYTISGVNEANKTTSENKTVIVEALPTFTNFTVNGLNSIIVAPSTSLTFNGIDLSSGSILEGRTSDGESNATLPANATSVAGTTTYYASAMKTLNNITKYSVPKSVTVKVVDNPTIGAINAPTNVFSGSSFNMSWTGANVKNYKIKSNNSTSGISSSDIDVGTNTSMAITPTAAGSYTYTLTATNDAGVTNTVTKSVVVESDPSFTVFTVNGAASASVVQSTAITFAGSGYSTGATLQGMNSAGTAESNLPSTASSAVTTTTYYASAKKTLNGISRYSPVKAVSVTTRSNIICPAYSTSNSVVYAESGRYQTWRFSGATVATLRSNAASVSAGGYTYTRGSLVGTAIVDEVGSAEYSYTICRQ